MHKERMIGQLVTCP